MVALLIAGSARPSRCPYVLRPARIRWSLNRPGAPTRLLLLSKYPVRLFCSATQNTRRYRKRKLGTMEPALALERQPIRNDPGHGNHGCTEVHRCTPCLLAHRHHRPLPHVSAGTRGAAQWPALANIHVVLRTALPLRPALLNLGTFVSPHSSNSAK